MGPSSALCDILYKRLRNTVTYLLTYLPSASVNGEASTALPCQCHEMEL